FSSRRRHTRSDRDWSSDVCSSDLRCTVTEGSFRLTCAASAGARLIVFVHGEAGYTQATSFLGAHPMTPATIGAVIVAILLLITRSEERRVGKECRSRGVPSD